jgi:uncharacterized protein (TIGR02246 family)
MRVAILAVAAMALILAGQVKPVDAADDARIRQLLDTLTAAWNAADAKAFAARYRADGTFTNVNGTFFVGRDEFERRHAEIFQGVFKGTTLTLTPRNLSLIRPDVAIVDLQAGVNGVQRPPPGIQIGSDGGLLTSLQLVLVKESDGWWIASYHNVWLAAAHFDK